ncbi:MAG: DUF3179 domain-containing protein [Candidatus Uhrbacteria bacterium]|nr:DUF3179 domain-containing protein [Candidatus Uhrbacteria bacterium]
MNTPKKVLAISVLAVAAIIVLYGIRSVRLGNLNLTLRGDELVDGLLVEQEKAGGESYLVPPNEIYDSGLSAEDIPAIDDPKFVSVTAADDVLADAVSGIDIDVNGEHRFYPYQILNWHHVVNDDFGGQKLAITYCPFCRSAVVYERVLGETELLFEASGKVYNNNFLISDRETGSLWSQMRGIGVVGEKVGETLTTYPSIVMTWAAWKALYPNGEVLSTDTGYARDYTHHPYVDYDMSDLIYFPLNATSTNLTQKWLVNGFSDSESGEHIAFSNNILSGFGAANETVGTKEITALYDFETGAIRVFDRKVGDQVLSLKYDFELDEITDLETGSVWSASGYAISGELQGTQLAELYAPESFWLCWYAAHPNTTVSGLATDGGLK